MSKIHIVTGAAGFIGSHLVDRLLELGHRVIGMDNLLLGKRANLVEAIRDPKFTFIEVDVNDSLGCLKLLRQVTERGVIETVWHMAANSDIQAGMANPDVDLWDTFMTTFNVLKLMKVLGIRQLVFASSSAVYGNFPGAITEQSGPLRPISNYGAMKLASEGAITAALETFLRRVWIFRFPNVVGSRATHGVIYDFVKKLLANRCELEVLGDGSQAKPYLHVSEVVAASVYIFQNAREPFNCYNIGTDGSTTTVKYIAESVVREAAPEAIIRYTGGNRGWVGDVPRFSYCVDKLRRLGWATNLTSNQAVDRAVKEVVKEIAT